MKICLSIPYEQLDGDLESLLCAGKESCVMKYCVSACSETDETMRLQHVQMCSVIHRFGDLNIL